jgi:hypothetical protein
VTDQPMTDDERALLEHRWAVRVNLPTDAGHVAALARRLVGVARYAAMPTATVERCERAAEQTEAVAAAIAGRVGAERDELARSGLDIARFQREVERTQSE